MSKNPWEFTPALTVDRLQRIASILRETRYDTVAAYDPKIGDGPWSLGCLAYERSINRIVQMSLQMPWLQIINHTLEFVFAIDGVPVRFYRGDGENPSTKQLACCHSELLQLSLINQENHGDLLWRIAIETDAAGFPTRILLVGFELDQHGKQDKGIMCHYEIPESIGTVSIFPNTPARRGDGIDLPSPMPSIPNNVEKGERALDDSED